MKNEHELDRTLRQAMSLLWVRSDKALRRARINTPRQLTNMTAKEVLAVRGIGEAYLNNIRESLAERGWRLQKDL